LREHKFTYLLTFLLLKPLQYHKPALYSYEERLLAIFRFGANCCSN